MRSRTLFFLFCFFVSACTYQSCGPDLNIDLSVPDECTPAGGECFGLFCPSGTHSESREGCGLLSACCMPGANPSGFSSSSSSGGFDFDAGTPIVPKDAGPAVGFCNLLRCAAGCTCRNRPIDDAGICEEVCDCPDASADASVDAASDADASVDAEADADTDAAADGGADAAADGGAVSCGVVTCADGCSCFDSKTGECTCPATGCQ